MLSLKQIYIKIFFITFVLTFISCATGSYAPIDNDVYAGDYKKALDILEKNKKSIYRNDVVLYYLDKGLLAHYAAEYKDSTAALENGDRAIETAFTKSITQNISSFVANDNTKEYAGEDYENLYLNIFNALNYYHLNNFEDAMVEIRRMEEKLLELKTRYNLVDNTLATEDKSAAKTANIKINFSNSALARYLGMLFYLNNGQFDDARIDRDWLKRAWTDEKNIYSYPMPSSIDEELQVPAGKARLNVLAFCGLSPVKEEETIRIALTSVNWIKIALPRMIKRTSVVNGIEVVFSDGKKFNLELLEDIQSIAVETFKKHQGIIEAKSIIRASIKAGAAAGFTAASEKNAAFGIIGFGLQIFAEASEQADLRSTRYFPAKALAGGITLNPGVYSFTVNYRNMSGSIIAAFPYKDITLKAGALNLIETVFLR